MVRLVEVTDGNESSPVMFEMAENTDLDMQQVETMMPLLSTYDGTVSDDGYVPL